MLFFALAVSFPLIGLIRLGIDSYSQSIRLKKREIFANYNQSGKDLDKLFISYRDLVRSLGTSFYNAPVLKKLHGSSKQNLWTDSSDDFFRKTSKDKINNLRRAYIKHYKELQRKVYSVFSKSDDIIDPSDCPISVQVIVLEKSFFSKPYYNKPIESEKFTYFELFKGTRPKGWNTRKERERYWGKLGIYDYFDQFPAHLTFPHKGEKDKLIWDGVNEIFRKMFRDQIVGPSSCLETRISMKNLFQKFPEETHGKFTNINLFGQSVTFYWQLYPKDFNFEKFSSLQYHKTLEMPLASYAIIIDDFKLETTYFSLLNREFGLKGLSFWVSELAKLRDIPALASFELPDNLKETFASTHKDYQLLQRQLSQVKESFDVFEENWFQQKDNLKAVSAKLGQLLSSFKKSRIKKQLKKINKSLDKHRKLLSREGVDPKVKDFMMSYKYLLTAFLKCYDLKSSLKKSKDIAFFNWQADYEQWKDSQEELFKKFTNSGISFEVLRRKKISKPHSSYFVLSEDSNSKTILKADDTLLKIESIIGILNPKTGEFALEKQLVDDYLSSEGNQVKEATVYDLIERVKATGKSSHFTYFKSGERWLGTLYPSKVIPEKVYFFTQSETFLVDEILSIAYGVISLVILALLSTLILGGLMSKRIVNPVAELTKKIARLAEGKYDEKVQINENNELGKLAHHFNEMADGIQENLFYMKAVDDINRLMNSNHSRMIMLKYILHLLSVKYRAGLGLIGFFHKSLSVRAHEYSIYESAVIAQDEQEALVAKMLKFVQDNQSSFLDSKVLVLTRGQLDYFHPSLKNGLIYYLGEQDDGDTIPVTGVLFLSDISDVLNQNKDMSVVVQMIENLCEQAKTIVMKSLLDEIGGDTEKGWEVQKSLMPNYDPDGMGCLDIASYFEGAIGLAGDYFDYLEFEDKTQLGFSIADVSGKGIGPSLFGATSRAFMKVLSQKYQKDTAQTLIDLNDNISFDKSSSLFLTMFYCVIDLKNMIMYYSSAGHNKMFLLKKSGELVHLSAKGLVIGMFAPVVYEQKSIEIEPGDEVILYTDGVTEHENPHLDLYGDDKFEDFCKEHQGISSKDWSDILAKDLEDFRAGIFPSDDITYIRIKILKQLEEENA